MKTILQCAECDYTARGYSEKQLMNRIVMWNHIKAVHPETTERMTKTHDVLPDYFYKTLEMHLPS